MRIGGFQKFSLADFPGHISSIIFTLGCGFRCPFCHNPELVDPAQAPEEIPLSAVLAFLDSRRGMVDGVVVTGGEPTLHADLPELLESLKHGGFAVKLDTNGTNPAMLENIVKRRLVDYVAMDVKAPLSAYARVVRAAVDTESIQRSIEIILRSELSHEFRTTYVESLLSIDDMMEIVPLVRGCTRYVLQRFQPTKSLDATILGQGSCSESSLFHVQNLMESAGLAASAR
jgi:pyruvate formate lyase activating enzyme